MSCINPDFEIGSPEEHRGEDQDAPGPSRPRHIPQGPLPETWKIHWKTPSGLPDTSSAGLLCPLHGDVSSQLHQVSFIGCERSPRNPCVRVALRI